MKNTFKSIFFLSLLGFIGLGEAIAQESKAGIKGGLNFSNFYGDEVDDQNIRLSLQGGVYFKAALTENFAIQPEVLFTTKGSTVKYDYPIIGKGELTQKLNYIEVPIMGVINITHNFNLHVGPYLSYLVGAKLENKSSNKDFDFVNDFDVDDFERIDYGVVAGIGFEIETLNFGARYDYGMNTIGKSTNDSTRPSVNKDFKNSTISLYFGLSF